MQTHTYENTFFRYSDLLKYIGMCVYESKFN